jgi:hypothetical protein
LVFEFIILLAIKPPKRPPRRPPPPTPPVDETRTNKNAAATAPIWRSGVSLFVAAKNLLDRDYIVDRTRGIRVGMPLLLQAGVEIEF